ncbi:hypothetical protein B0H13DRAFT_1863845 [Mycena leptocephala]|nr:hypothetical protein B0H13DRAFT_1863845 [Mycena leptocephala]
MHKASLFMGDLLYGKDFRLGPETRTERDNGDHSFHKSCVLYGGTPFKAIILGVLKGVVRLNDTDKSLTKMVEMDRARRPKVVLSESSWVQDDTVIITTCALTKMNVVESGANAGRAVRGQNLEAQIGDLMRCTVVLHLENRSCSGCKGHEVYYGAQDYLKIRIAELT